MMAESNQAKLARKALAQSQKRRSADHRPPPERHAHGGAVEQPRPDYPPSGAFDAEGHRPVLERSRKVR
jgi:hypothetical protein